jgi:ferredoxin
MLSDVLIRNQVDIPMGCNGTQPVYNINEKPIQPWAEEPLCAECMVDISVSWNKQIEMHPYERAKINDSLSNFKENSRLACCVRVEGWMDEMMIEIRNVNADSDSIRHGGGRNRKYWENQAQVEI